MDSYIYELAPLIGFVAMLAGGFWGLGGGWFVVPALLILGVDLQTAVGASLLQMMLSSCPTVIRQFKSIGWQRDGWGLRVALPLTGAAFLGGLFGRPVSSLLINIFDSTRPQQIIYLLLLGYIFFKTLLHVEPTSDNDGGTEETRQPPKLIRTSILGFITGVLSALLGIGGGTVNRPVLRNFLKVPEVYTGKIARLAVLLVAISGSISYLSVTYGENAGNVRSEILWLGVLLAVGGFIGFALGAWTHHLLLEAGRASHASKSFAWMVLPILIGVFLKLLDLNLCAQITVLIAGGFLFIYLGSLFISVRKTGNYD